jgi:hypothetical protein
VARDREEPCSDAELAAVQREGRLIVLQRELQLLREEQEQRETGEPPESERQRLLKVAWLSASPEERESMERPRGW